MKFVVTEVSWLPLLLSILPDLHRHARIRISKIHCYWTAVTHQGCNSKAEAKIERQSTVCKFSRVRSESSLFSGIDKRRFDTEPKLNVCQLSTPELSQLQYNHNEHNRSVALRSNG
eukprot:scaffold389_cov62-Cyclotella_meneghiniana.AAC.2